MKQNSTDSAQCVALKEVLIVLADGKIDKTSRKRLSRVGRVLSEHLDGEMRIASQESFVRRTWTLMSAGYRGLALAVGIIAAIATILMYYDVMNRSL